MENLDEKIDRIELKLERMVTIMEIEQELNKEHRERVEPVIQDFVASGVLKKKLLSTLKFLGVLFGVLVAGHEVISAYRPASSVRAASNQEIQ